MYEFELSLDSKLVWLDRLQDLVEVRCYDCPASESIGATTRS